MIVNHGKENSRRSRIGSAKYGKGSWNLYPEYNNDGRADG